MKFPVLIKSSIAIGLLFASSVYAQTSTFDLTSEGWTALGDVAAPLTWVATGGSPGGHVSIIDSVTGGTTYFVAPSSYLGNKVASIGKSLTFDLQQSYPGPANQFRNSDVVLMGGGLTLAYDTAQHPANGAWTSYAVPLNAAGWHIGNYLGAAVTDAQFKSVMSSLTALQIRAEYQTGSDTGKLDNVMLAVPEPSAYAMFLLGLLGLAIHSKRRKS
jgi:hypothetical protein